ncbi:MAG: DEAD/DEAH box helicase [Acidimicrobiales bacterium]
MALTEPGRVRGRERGVRGAFVAGLPFEMDPFQLEAMDALDGGHSVVVAAPTGSGKTVVAEYAVARALAAGGKAFYTTPLKALSNQKFADFSGRLGAANVGLLTGDNSINGEAPVVVMTTEVLRNMIYAGSTTLTGLRYVVLDEVHYLQDPYRGPVWEEVIIHLPPEVDLVCLSATVSNAEELADWVGTVRGSTRAVIEERRPVPLHNLFLVGDRRSEHLLLVPTLVDGRPNPRGIALTARADRGEAGWRARRRSGLFAPRRAETVELLDEQGLLPAIYFIFSRAGCDEAVRQCLRESRRLTGPAERRQIREAAVEAAGGLSDADLAALGWSNWLAGLEAGFASHHAGLVPPFKEAVERLFLTGLVRVVFATETLALGINMPARCVLIERLAKFGGERVEPLTPGEYTQLTGRAGRRGTDEVGYAVVSWAPNVTFDQVASLAGARSYTLTSSFRPTYNMATNLVRRCTPEQAHHLLNLSFAQYRADADTVRLESHLERAREQLQQAMDEAKCSRGDVFEYWRLGRADDGGPRRAEPGGTVSGQVRAAMARLQPGDVLLVPARRPGGAKASDRVAVLSTRQRNRHEISLRVITSNHRLVSLAAKDFHRPPQVVGRLDLPVPFAPNNRAFQRQVALLLATATGARHGAEAARPGTGPEGRRRRGGAGGEQASRRVQGAGGEQAGEGPGARHPVASCPERGAHLRAAAGADHLGRQVERLQRQVRGRTESLALQFDRVLGLLEAWGYVRGWALTEPGRRLARIYHEQDLLVAECAERGLLDGLQPAEMAAVVSFFTYEPRGPMAGPSPAVKLPTRRVEERWREVQAVARALTGDEERAGLPVTRPPEAGFACLAHGWASGSELATLVSPPGAPKGSPHDAGRGAISAGDFVRNIKQLTDLLRQLGEVLAGPAAAGSARRAAGAMFRGVVAASSVVEVGK